MVPRSDCSELFSHQTSWTLTSYPRKSTVKYTKKKRYCQEAGFEAKKCMSFSFSCK
jgi:hypothetical protein